MDPVEVGRDFVDQTFTDCNCAFVAGSFLRGEATETSDLDLVVIVGSGQGAPFRASYRYRDWPVEAFVHTLESCRRYFQMDVIRRRPSLCSMVVEGMVVRDTEGLARNLVAEAREILARGPEPLGPAEVESLRYGLTDTLDDLLGCERSDEGVLIAAQLASQAAYLLLLMHRQWIGEGKWVLRALRRFNPDLADGLGRALIAYGRTGDKDGLMRFGDDALALAGGRLFEGYYAEGK